NRLVLTPKQKQNTKGRNHDGHPLMLHNKESQHLIFHHRDDDHPHSRYKDNPGIKSGMKEEPLSSKPTKEATEETQDHASKCQKPLRDPGERRPKPSLQE